ncbi:MAG: Bor/Iss family lipoprotein [Rhodothermales bacterium]
MMHRYCLLLLLMTTVVLAGCYHTRIETGLAPSALVFNKPFVSGWLYGLVPTKTVRMAAECPNGVAIVETEASFVNQLVWGLTMGIYTPMHVKVTCASESSRTGEARANPEGEVHIPRSASMEEVLEAFSVAADRAVSSDEPVLVLFD